MDSLLKFYINFKSFRYEKTLDLWGTGRYLIYLNESVFNTYVREFQII
jgi:hypothetical protein